jgi:uncharacterized protein YjiS (DUF1127 family)
MHTREPYRQYRRLEVDDWRSPDRPLAIAVRATHPVYGADLFAEFAGLFARRKVSVPSVMPRLNTMVREWRRRARSRRELLALDDHMLKDIGITRIDAQYEAAKFSGASARPAPETPLDGDWTWAPDLFPCTTHFR